MLKTRKWGCVFLAIILLFCGVYINIDNIESRNILSQFLDYIKLSKWSKESVAFCYKEKILSTDVMEIQPFENVTRAEVAYMICNMLRNALLI